MYKYKIMIIDDEIKERIEYLKDFFTNEPLEKNNRITKEQKGRHKKMVKLEFDVTYPQEYDILDEFVRDNRVDAYFLDVYLENNAEWDLGMALSAICKHNPKAPIFMYSTDWKDKDVLEKISKGFKQSFPGKTASYYYDLNYINSIVNEFREAACDNQIDQIGRERKFIKNMIVKAYGKTEKEPFSNDGDIAILHISDIQYGDSNTTEFNKNLWAEVARICKELKDKKIISGVDLLVITGDISMHGKSDEMKDARNELKKYLFKKLWKNEYETKEYQERILLVPGNHDYDLNFCTIDYLVSENGPNKGDRNIDFDKASTSLKSKHKINNYHDMGLTAYKDFAYNITNNPIYYQRKNLNYIENRFTSWNLRFICLNTCDGICADKTNGIGMDNDEIKEIINDNYDDECYTIMLSHHTPLFEEELLDKEKEEFHANCTSLITSCRANIWLGGHRHVQKDETISATFQKVEVYEAPTISLKEEWSDEPDYKVQTVNGEWLNSRRGFQIILLENRESSSYTPKLIKYIFDNNGVAQEVRS